MALDASLTVLQEARRPAVTIPGQVWIGPNPRNGLAAIPGPGFEVTLGPLHPNAPWSIVPLRLRSASTIHLLLVWTRAEHKYLRGLDIALSEYASFLREAPSVVLGDFNANAIWDNPRRSTDFSRVAARLATEFCLTSAYHTWNNEEFGAESQATHYFWRQRARPFHIDYCFIPEAWKRHLSSVQLLDLAPWDSLSDHRPLVVEVSSGAV